MALRLRSNAPTIARDDEDDVLGRLRRMRGETEEETSSAVPKTEEKEETEERDPLDRLQAMREAAPQPTKDREAPAASTPAASTPAAGSPGRIRPGWDTADAARASDDQDRREKPITTMLNSAVDRMHRLNDAAGVNIDDLREDLTQRAAERDAADSALGQIVEPWNRANAAAQNLRSQVAAYETKLGMLQDTMYNSDDPEERRRAQQESQALDLYYQKAQRAAERYESRFQDLNTQFQQAAIARNKANKGLQEGLEQYNTLLSLGDKRAKKLEQEAEELRAEADRLYRAGEVNAPTLRLAEQAEARAAQERQNYAEYLYGTKGQSAANRYLSGEEAGNRMKAEQTSFAQKVLNTVGGAGANWFSNYGGSPLILMADLMGMHDEAEALRASDPFSSAAQEMRQNAGKVGGMIIDTAGAAGHMMSTAAFGGIAAGGLAGSSLMTTLTGIAESSPLVTSAAARAGAKLATGLMGEFIGNAGNAAISLSSGVSGFNEARENGASFEQAMTNGVLRGLAEYYSNKLFSGMPLENAPGEKGYVTKAIEWVAEKLGKSKALEAFNKTTGGKVLSWIYDKAGEGLEEVVTGLLDPVIDRITYDNEADWKPKLDELVDEFIGGVMLSLLMSGGEKVLGPVLTKEAIVDELVSQGIPRAEARKYAGPIYQDMKAAEKVQKAIEKAMAEAQPAQAAEARAPAEAPAEAPAQQTTLQQKAEKYAEEGRLSGQDARDILADPDAKQALIDAGLITGREMNDSAGRTKVAQAAEQYSRNMQTEGQTAPPVPGQAEETATPVQAEVQAEAQAETATVNAETPPVPRAVQTPAAQQNAPQAGQAANTETSESKTIQRTLAAERQKTAGKAESLQDYGFTTAGDDATARVRNEENWDAEEQAVGQALRDLGYEPTFAAGIIQNAEGDSVPYLVEGNKIAIRADSRQTLQTLAEQAVGKALNIDQGVRNQVMETITQARAEARAARQTTKTTAEKPTVSARAQATMESARAAGASEEDGALAGRLADIIGRDIRFFNEAGKDGAWKNGYTQNGVIYINAQAKKPVAWVVGHELTHNVEHSKIYDSLKKLAQKEMGLNWSMRVQSRLDASARIAQKLGDDSVRLTDPADAEREIVADFFADRLLSDEAAIRRVCEYEPVTARNIRDYIKSLLRKLGGKETTLERALTLYNKALKDVAAKAQADAEGRMRLKGTEAQKQESGLRLGSERQYSTQDEVLARTDIDWMNDFSSIKEQLEKHAEEINKMQPVAEVQYYTEQGPALAKLVMNEVPKLGGKNMSRDGITFVFDEVGAGRIVHHAAKTREINAAALAAPYVAKYGKLIAGHRNHENTGTTTITYASPVILNGDTVNVGVVIQFEKGGRPRAVNVELQNGGVFKLKKIEAPKGSGSLVYRLGKGKALPTMSASEVKVTQNNEKSKRQFSVDDADTYNRTALVTEDTVDKWLKDYAAKSSPKYAQAYITRMTPKQFVDLTTSTTGRLLIGNQTEALDAEKLIEATRDQPLQIQISDGEVVGHEGRHRATALSRAGVNSIPVLVFDYSNKYSKTDVPEMTLQGQDFGRSRSYATETLRDLIPLSYENRDRIVQEYGTQPATERLQEKYNGRKTVQFSAEDSDDEYRQTPETPALEKLGIRLAASKGRYHLAEQLLERDKAAKELMKATKKAERKLNATKAEKEFAAGIASGIYDEADIPSTMDKDKVTTLADYYTAEESFKLNMLSEVRGMINEEYQDEAEGLLKDVDGFKKLSMLQMNERTPDRTFRAMFGPEQGKQIFDWLIRPVQLNEAEKTRWHQTQLDRVRKFKDSKGKTRELTRDESALTMLVMEGKAAAQAVADLEADAEKGNAIKQAARDLSRGMTQAEAAEKYGLTEKEVILAQRYRQGAQERAQREVANLVAKEDTAQRIKNAAENIRNGEDPGDAAWEFGLKDNERDMAVNYATWMDTQEKLKNADSTIIETAAKEYAKIFDEFYDAINDFLVAHGYEPIGYIKGYAPHMQPEETQNLLEKAFDKMGIDLGNDKAQGLPANIAGETAYFKPNKRWDPYFLHRTGTKAEYDIVKAYQSYVGYLSDILYHTDDIMRVRNMEKMIRKTYAPDDISEVLSQIKFIRSAPVEDRLSFLRDAGKIGRTTQLSTDEINDKLDEWEEEQYQALAEDKQYNNLVMWLSNYANILAGKQSFADRGWEYSLGRNSLNFANRLQAAFQRSLVAGSLTSALNQTAQLPMIKAELGDRWYYAALKDILTGQTRGFWKDSDFLTGKHGVDMLYTDNYDKFISALFKPSTVVDNIVSTTAVRGAFLKAVHQGQSYSEAMRTADDFGRRIMGSREKGTRPLAYESKGLFSRMIHMFQVEAANSWDHIASDLPYEIKEIARTQGKPKAARTLAALIVKALLSTFLLNRLTEETYGGTPAPFDVIGLALNFVASGQGMTTNQKLRQIIDNVLEQVGQDRYFGTQSANAEFDVGKGLEELGYNVMNDVPLLRNLAGVLGLGDQTVPLPGAGGEFKDVATAVSDIFKDGADGQNIENLIRASAKLGAQFVPAGRQLTKTGEGIEAVIKGGSYSKKGKLQYTIDDPEDKVRAILFGKNSTTAAQEHWASGENTLSEKQTDLVEKLRGQKMSGAEARNAVQTVKSFSGDDKRDQTVAYIDSLNTTNTLKDELYYYAGYKESTIDSTPWHGGKTGGKSGKGKTYAMANQSSLLANPSDRMNDQDRELYDMENHGGNVNLRTRKTIPVTKDNIDTVRGWGMDSQVGDYMTVASQTYRDGSRAIVVTPILPSGKLMTQAELDAYMDSLRGSDSYADADDRGIILGVFDDGNWEQNLKESDAFAERIHELHEEREEKRKTTGLQLPAAPKAQRQSSGLRLPSAPAAKPSSGGLRLK